MKKVSQIVVVLLLLAAVFYFSQRKKSGTASSSTSSNQITSVVGNELYRHHPLQFSHHARCRMDCRNITESEIETVLHEGKINERKSEPDANRCPRWALEDEVDGKRVRVIVGDCDNKAVIITVIDLDHEFECHCPGDENK